MTASRPRDGRMRVPLNGGIGMKRTNRIHDIAYIALFTALLAICAWIAVPVSIPFTLQTAAVFLAVGLLGWRRGTIAVAVYILLGALGAPVFSGFRGGFGVLLGATGGYIFGFLPAAAVSGAIMDRFGRKMWVMLGAMALGMIICYLFGTAWFVWVYMRSAKEMGFFGALGICVVPYLLPDALKLLLAAWLTTRLRGRIGVATNETAA